MLRQLMMLTPNRSLYVPCQRRLKRNALNLPFCRINLYLCYFLMLKQYTSVEMEEKPGIYLTYQYMITNIIYLQELCANFIK